MTILDKRRRPRENAKEASMTRNTKRISPGRRGKSQGSREVGVWLLQPWRRRSRAQTRVILLKFSHIFDFMILWFFVILFFSEFITKHIFRVLS